MPLPIEFSTQPEDKKDILITQLQQLGVKCTPEKILRIEKLPNDKIIFLEEGKSGKRGSGLKHILEQHKSDFANLGIAPDQLSDILMTALLQNKIVGYQGIKEPRREIYEVIFKEKIYHIAISIGNNGYIVGANPVTYP